MIISTITTLNSISIIISRHQLKIHYRSSSSISQLIDCIGKVFEYNDDDDDDDDFEDNIIELEHSGALNKEIDPFSCCCCCFEREIKNGDVDNE